MRIAIGESWNSHGYRSGLRHKGAGCATRTFEDAFVEGLPADARAELFENRAQFRRTGRLHRFPGGFQIASATEPPVSASFAPLFPALAALLHQLGVPHGSLYVAPLSATLAIIGLFLVAAHLGGRRAAWLTVALTLAAMPQLWFARMPMPETVAQCFVMAGLLAWLVALRDGAPRWAVAAGWFFGLACFAKVDLNVLLSVSLVVFAAWRGLTRPAQGARPLGWLLASFVPLVVHNVAHYLIFPTDYAPVSGGPPGDPSRPVAHEGPDGPRRLNRKPAPLGGTRRRITAVWGNAPGDGRAPRLASPVRTRRPVLGAGRPEIRSCAMLGSG